MAVAVSPTIRKRAEALAQLVPLMPRGRSKVTGQGFYLIPSSQKPLTVAYYSSSLGCTCPGFRNRGVCAHQQACLIVLQQAEAQRIAAGQPIRKSAQQLFAEAGPFGPCCHKGCSAAATGKGRRCEEHFTALLDKLGY